MATKCKKNVSALLLINTRNFAEYSVGRRNADAWALCVGNWQVESQTWFEFLRFCCLLCTHSHDIYSAQTTTHIGEGKVKYYIRQHCRLLSTQRLTISKDIMFVVRRRLCAQIAYDSSNETVPPPPTARKSKEQEERKKPECERIRWLPRDDDTLAIK